MAKKKGKSRKAGKGKRKARRSRKQIAAQKRNLKKAHAANRKGKKGRKKAKKTGSKKKGRKRSSKVSILGYKAAVKAAAEKKAIREKLLASGKPPAVVAKIMARLYRGRSAKKTKSTGWFKGYRAAEDAERAAAYMRANYGRHVSYN